MSNTQKITVGEIEITVSSVSGKFAKIVTTLTFAKGGKVVKEAYARDLDRLVRPENRAVVAEAIKSTESAVEVSVEHRAAIVRQAKLDACDDSYDMITRTMAVQG